MKFRFFQQKLLGDDAAYLTFLNHGMDLVESYPSGPIRFSGKQDNFLQRSLTFQTVMVIKHAAVPGFGQKFKFVF